MLASTFIPHPAFLITLSFTLLSFPYDVVAHNASRDGSVVDSINRRQAPEPPFIDSDQPPVPSPVYIEPRSLIFECPSFTQDGQQLLASTTNEDGIGGLLICIYGSFMIDATGMILAGPQEGDTYIVCEFDLSNGALSSSGPICPATAASQDPSRRFIKDADYDNGPDDSPTSTPVDDSSDSSLKARSPAPSKRFVPPSSDEVPFSPLVARSPAPSKRYTTPSSPSTDDDASEQPLNARSPAPSKRFIPSPPSLEVDVPSSLIPRSPAPSKRYTPSSPSLHDDTSDHSLNARSPAPSKRYVPSSHEVERDETVAHPETPIDERPEPNSYPPQRYVDKRQLAPGSGVFSSLMGRRVRVDSERGESADAGGVGVGVGVNFVSRVIANRRTANVTLNHVERDEEGEVGAEFISRVIFHRGTGNVTETQNTTSADSDNSNSTFRSTNV